MPEVSCAAAAEPTAAADVHVTIFLSLVSFSRNVSSDGAEARQRLRDCEGLVEALLHALHSALVNKDTDNKVIPSHWC